MENNDAEPIILDQIANYNFQELEKNIALYKKYLNNQLALNRTWKETEDYHETFLVCVNLRQLLRK